MQETCIIDRQEVICIVFALGLHLHAPNVVLSVSIRFNQLFDHPSSVRNDVGKRIPSLRLVLCKSTRIICFLEVVLNLIYRNTIKADNNEGIILCGSYLITRRLCEISRKNANHHVLISYLHTSHHNLIYDWENKNKSFFARNLSRLIYPTYLCKAFT